MALQAILDRFEFRPEPETTLTEAARDLRGAVRVLGEAVDDGPTAVTSAELESALRTSRDRIETCHGIIAAHGFADPIVEGVSGRSADDLDWADIGRFVDAGRGNGKAAGRLLKDAYEAVPTAEASAVGARTEADRLALLGAVPDRLPTPTGARASMTGDLRVALLLVAAVTYLLAGFGTHPTAPEPAADRVLGGYWLLASVLVGGAGA